MNDYLGINPQHIRSYFLQYSLPAMNDKNELKAEIFWLQLTVSNIIPKLCCNVYYPSKDLTLHHMTFIIDGNSCDS